MERFTWADWEKGGGSPDGKSAADWGKEYAAVKVATVQPSTYRTNYQERLESLPDKPLTEELLLSHVQQRSKINTKGRRDDCIAFRQLAKFAGLTVDFSGVKGRYEPKPLSPDDVPSDSEIEVIWAAIVNPGWKWVYGMLATYGLRPHEVFRIANTKGIATDTGKISILDDSKTGRRDVWPLPDRWRSQFNLTDVVFPKIRFEGRDNQQLGERVGANLCGSKDRKIPHRPYALRQAWAIRSAVMGVPDSIAARWMGHSVAVHAKTYHAAISQLQHEAIWRRANQLGNSI
ncbi:hypothetical protein PGN35_010320 [Nodosilinea sp. PGN35]|uniref:hypothetical protein n=1 Tax=Nodosilinea sp. PGN35 TaxID=3020489 RepID=UPI00398B709C